MTAVVAYIHLEHVFKTFVDSVVLDSMRIVESERISSENVLLQSVVPEVATVIAEESLHFREFGPYLQVDVGDSNVRLSVAAVNKRFCGFTCADSTKAEAILSVENGQLVPCLWKFD
jgi:hypothetical protein